MTLERIQTCSQTDLLHAIELTPVAQVSAGQRAIPGAKRELGTKLASPFADVE